MLVHSSNNTAGTENLCPWVCVFGGCHRPSRNGTDPTQISPARAVDDATEAILKENAERRMKFALKYRAPLTRDRTSIGELLYGALIRLY